MACNRLSCGSASSDLDNLEDQTWMCSHYERCCYVKCECCDTFWPCHRCHNSTSLCSQRHLSATDIEMVRCKNCDEVQQFAATCCNCGLEFADYCCLICKTLTGTENYPYHCETCGICRNGLTYHCDICGVCLDMNLLETHICREGSAHDPCVICLQDTILECHLLPCSHKVHQECETQMISNGITRCPVCCERFA